jgi:tRNA-dihydrouridine synthase
LRRHLAANLDFYGADKGLILFRKHAAKYIRGVYGASELRVRLLTCNSVEEFARLVQQVADTLPVRAEFAGREPYVAG